MKPEDKRPSAAAIKTQKAALKRFHGTRQAEYILGYITGIEAALSWCLYAKDGFMPPVDFVEAAIAFYREGRLAAKRKTGARE